MEEGADESGRNADGFVLLVVNVILGIGLCWGLGKAVPAFGEIFEAFGAQLPTSTQIVLTLSNRLLAFHGAGLAILAALLTSYFVWSFVLLRQQRRRVWLLRCLWCSMLAMLILCAFSAISLYLPVFPMGYVQD